MLGDRRPEHIRQFEKQLRAGQTPDTLVINYVVDLSNSDLAQLPDGLTITNLNLSNSKALTALPGDLQVRRLYLEGCDSLRELPAHFTCHELSLRNMHFKTLPPDLDVDYRLDLTGSQIEELPPNLTVSTLILRDCIHLRALPEGLTVNFLDISGCIGLTGWPEHASVSLGHVTMRNCTGITSLPPWMTRIAQLDLRGCVQIAELPDTLWVSSWIDVADTAIRALPDRLKHVELRWRGVRVDERLAFQPETITGTEVLNEPNVERRRVLLERMGYERFLQSVEAEVLDEDGDAGGVRRLLRVPIPGDEDLVVVAVICPSTARQYLLRVPPNIRTCREAVAWTAGYDDASTYQPVAET